MKRSLGSAPLKAFCAGLPETRVTYIARFTQKDASVDHVDLEDVTSDTGALQRVR